MNEDRKIAEARYFLDQMRKPEIHDDRVVFGYNLSAFLSAARSALQYLRDASQSSNRQSWYDTEMSVTRWCSVFKDLRDGNIHEKPTTPRANHFVILTSALTIGDSLTVVNRTESDGKSDGHVVMLQPIHGMPPLNLLLPHGWSTSSKLMVRTVAC